MLAFIIVVCGVWIFGSIMATVIIGCEYQQNGCFFRRDKDDNSYNRRYYKFGWQELAKTIEEDDLETIWDHIASHIAPIFWPIVMLIYIMIEILKLIARNFNGTKTIANAVVNRTKKEIEFRKNQAVTKQEKEGGFP